MDAILDEIFKAYDIRGIVGEQLNDEIVYDIGRSYASWLPKKGPVAVGYDMRPDSEAFAKALIKGIVDQGRDVWNLGMIATDMIYYTVGSNKLAGGAVVTASHSPGEYNGIKLCREDAKPIGENSGLLEIKEKIKSKTFKKPGNKGSITKKDVTEDWIDFVLSFIDVNKLTPIKIAVDVGNGMAGAIFAELEPFVPWQVTEMYFEPDGTFPNHEANPMKPETLIDIKKMIKNEKLNGGVAFDGDGDRAVLIDENGEALTGTVMTAVLADYFLQKNPGATVLHNAICGKSAIEAIETNGGTAIRTKVGHSYIKADMRKYNAVFAGEHSCHYFFRDNYYADSGLLAVVIGLYALSISGKQSLSELAKPYRSAYVQIPETNFEVADKEAVLAKIKTEYAKYPMDELDGVTVHIDDGWFNVRPSNTEPLLRLNAEAKKFADLEKIVKEVTGLINN